jgi:hypothetical protein
MLGPLRLMSAGGNALLEGGLCQQRGPGPALGSLADMFPALGVAGCCFYSSLQQEDLNLAWAAVCPGYSARLLWAGGTPQPGFFAPSLDLAPELGIFICKIEMRVPVPAPGEAE